MLDKVESTRWTTGWKHSMRNNGEMDKGGVVTSADIFQQHGKNR